MPIQLVCTSCGKRLQVGDQYAGRRVSCPGCKTILTAPGTPAAPAAPPPAAPKPPPPSAAKPAPLPLPPPPPPERKPAREELPFSFGPPKGKPADAEEEDDKPKTPPKRGTAAAGKKTPPGRPRDEDDEDDDDRPRRSGRGRGRDDGEAARPGAKAWRSFGAGSALAKWGLWIEFLALAYGLGMTAYILTALFGDTVAVLKRVNDAGGPAVIAPMFLGIALGSILTLIGRTRMISIPPGTGAKKVFFGAWALTVVRILTTLAAAGLILMASSEWPDITKSGADVDKAGKDALLHMFLAFAAFAVGTPFWILADLSTIPAMAIVGGEIPDARLRQKAGQVTFILQMLILAYVISGITAGFGLSQIEWDALKGDNPDAAATTGTTGRPTTGTGTATLGTGGRMSGSSATDRESAARSAKTAIMFSAGLGIIVQLAYTALFASMYGAGRRAAADARAAEEAAEDEDI